MDGKLEEEPDTHQSLRWLKMTIWVNIYFTHTKNDLVVNRKEQSSNICT